MQLSRIGKGLAQTSTRLLHLYDPFSFLFFLYFHRLSRFQLTLCNSLLSIFHILRSCSKNPHNHRSYFNYQRETILKHFGSWDTGLIVYVRSRHIFRNERNLGNLYSRVYTFHTSSPDGSIQSRTDGHALANIFHATL